MTKQEIERHKQKFSKSDFGWKNDYDAMAKKTVLRNMLSKWGILSIEMQKATITDETIVNDVTEDGSIISETEIEDGSERKEAEPIIDQSNDQTEEQTALFDDTKPPLK